MRRIILALILAFSVSHASTLRPKLVLFIVVDMMREDTFDRLGDLFTGGFRYLQENGIYFSEARHGIAYAATGPGPGRGPAWVPRCRVYLQLPQGRRHIRPSLIVRSLERGHQPAGATGGAAGGLGATSNVMLQRVRSCFFDTTARSII